jgi:HlyD family secretion protein
VAERTTRDALLRLRRVHEIDAKRVLVEARGELSRAQAASERANARAVDAEEKLAAARGQAAPLTAGRLATRERYLGRLRETAEKARERARSLAHAAATAESELERAQKGLEAALRAREAAESRASALAIREQRRRARREDSANDDRWRRK